jgi:hypothetical protein
MTAGDIEAEENGNQGAYLLKRWLEYVASGVLDSGEVTEREPDSDFEAFVIDLESAEFSVVTNLLLTRVLGGTRQHHPFYQFPCRFFRGFLEFQYHREIRGQPKRPVKYEDFALRIQQRNRHSRV